MFSLIKMFFDSYKEYTLYESKKILIDVNHGQLRIAFCGGNETYYLAIISERNSINLLEICSLNNIQVPETM